jgi:hypothetical protein
MSVKEAISKAPVRRAKRTTLGTRNILTVGGKDPNFEYRIVNDTGDRVLFLQNQDWEIVEAADVQIGDKRLGNPATTSSNAEVSVGGGIKAYVMKKRKDWHEEDQATKQEYVNQTEAATKEQALNGTYGKINLNARSNER